jgi:hypothetical protein
MTSEEVDALFREADTDGNGRVAGPEATALFNRSQLPQEQLSRVGLPKIYSLG